MSSIFLLGTGHPQSYQKLEAYDRVPWPLMALSA